MTFTAYQARHDGTDFSSKGRDEAAGILGRHTPSEAPPVVTAHTLEELKLEARAYLGKEPDALLYLTDADRRVHQIMLNEKHHAAIDSAGRRNAISIALLVFCVTCLLGASLGALGAWALLSFVSAVALYALILRVGLLNEIEGAVLCEILLILALILIPALHRVRSIAAEPGAAPDRGRITGLVRHQAIAAAPAGELGRWADQRRANTTRRAHVALFRGLPTGDRWV